MRSASAPIQRGPCLNFALSISNEAYYWTDAEAIIHIDISWIIQTPANSFCVRTAGVLSKELILKSHANKADALVAESGPVLKT